MKNNIFIISILIFLSICTVNAEGQETNKKLSKTEKKELKRQTAIEGKKIVVELIESGKWIIEIENFINGDGQNIRKNPLRNFLGVKGDLGIINLEGITITQRIYEGSVEKYELIKGKEKAQPMLKFHYKGRGQGSSLKADLLIVVNNNKMANVTWRDDVGSNFSFSGRIIPWDQSEVFKEDY